jgi:hypothetical protein
MAGEDEDRHAVVMITAPEARRLDGPAAADDRSGGQQLVDDLALTPGGRPGTPLWSLSAPFKNHSCRRCPPSPRGLSGPSLGPTVRAAQPTQEASSTYLPSSRVSSQPGRGCRGACPCAPPAGAGRRVLILGQPLPVADRAADLRCHRAGPAPADLVDDVRPRAGAAGLPPRPRPAGRRSRVMGGGAPVGEVTGRTGWSPAAQWRPPSADTAPSARGAGRSPGRCP